MDPTAKITPDNINVAPQQPVVPQDPIQGSPFGQAPVQPAMQPQAPVAPALNPNLAPSAPVAPVAPDAPVQTQPAAPVAPVVPNVDTPVQSAPTTTPFKLPQQMIQRITNPGAEYYREDTLQKAHAMRAILHAQPKAWTMVPLGYGEKPDSMLPVGINGYFVFVRKGVMVEVPFQVAQMIADSFNQDRLIGAEHDLSQNEEKQRALA